MLCVNSALIAHMKYRLLKLINSRNQHFYKLLQVCIFMKICLYFNKRGFSIETLNTIRKNKHTNSSSFSLKRYLKENVQIFIKWLFTLYKEQYVNN